MKWSVQIKTPYYNEQSEAFTFSSGQHTPVWSCSSYFQVLVDNFPTAKKQTTAFQLQRTNRSLHSNGVQIITGKLIWVEGPQYLSAARS